MAAMQVIFGLFRNRNFYLWISIFLSVRVTGCLFSEVLLRLDFCDYYEP